MLKVRASSSSAGITGAPYRTTTRGRPGSGQLRPRGIAAYVPRSTTGTAGTCWVTHRCAGPRRRPDIQPSSLRVASGNSSRLHPRASRLRSRRERYRSTGNALNASAVTAARQRASKK